MPSGRIFCRKSGRSKLRDRGISEVKALLADSRRRSVTMMKMVASVKMKMNRCEFKEMKTSKVKMAS